ncbi:hypothetical protein EVAR_27284_1 [Eumeta japonica]|uniref:Uncharacterized protein n=1 Tax=Eumeta variegata TaxID=151549 RepID=A0A4C1UC93_EUMVA|nr:hypothetical protein EVAR_27284_1 [Eumeta japonica]
MTITIRKLSNSLPNRHRVIFEEPKVKSLIFRSTFNQRYGSARAAPRPRGIRYKNRNKSDGTANVLIRDQYVVRENPRGFAQNRQLRRPTNKLLRDWEIRSNAGFPPRAP